MRRPHTQKILIAAGGTGGHLFAGIAIAKAWQALFASEGRPEFVGTKRGLEQKKLADYGFPLHLIYSESLSDRGFFGRLWVIVKLPLSLFSALRLLGKVRPGVVLGIGGYTAGAILLAAWLAGVPSALIEPNAVPGLANRLAAQFVDKIFVGFAAAAKSFDAGKVLLTGTPVRISTLAHVNRLPTPTVLVLGGSQGAHAVNQLVVEALPHLSHLVAQVEFIHQTGLHDEPWVRAAYRQQGFRAEVAAFFEDMEARYKRAMMAISRAGALTLSELALFGVPALMIPYPLAADGHQEANARFYEAQGGGMCLLQSTLTGEILAAKISHWWQNPDVLVRLAAGMRSAAFPDATQKIVAALKALGGMGT